MKNFINKFKYLLIGGSIVMAGTIFASQISVPSSPDAGKLLQGLSTGNYAPVSLTAGTNITLSTTTANVTIGLTSNTISGVALGGTLANLSATDSTLTFSGTYTGATARTIGLNLGTTNAWTAAATTTYTNGLQASYLNLTGTSATSTASNGFNISNGCYAVNGTCIGSGSGSGTVGSGTTGQFPFYNSAGTTLTATSSLFLDQSGNIGIGTTTPPSALTIVSTTVGSPKEIEIHSMNAAGMNIYTHSDTNFRGPVFQFNRSEGTFGSPTALSAAGDTIGYINWNAYDGSAYASAAAIRAISDQAWTTGAHGTYLAFETALQGTTSFGERMRISSAGNVGIGTTSPYSLLSVGNTSGIGFTTATSTFNTTGGINLQSGGCFAIAGVCINGSGSSITGTTGQIPYFSGTNTAVGTSTLFLNAYGYLGLSTTSPRALLSLGVDQSGAASTTASGGINFGDPTANMYRSGTGTIKTDGTLIPAQGILGDANVALTIKGNRNTGAQAQVTSNSNLTFTTTGQVLLVGTSAAGSFAPTTGGGVLNTVEIQQVINQSASATGVTRGLYINPTLTKTVDYRALEIGEVTNNIDLSTTTLMSARLGQMTYASTTAATITNAITEHLVGAPIASTNVTISTSTGLLIDSRRAVNADGGTVTNAYGLQVYSPTGATNNYDGGFGVQNTSATIGHCFKAKNVGGNSFTYWYFDAANVQHTSGVSCEGTATSTTVFN